MVNWPDNEGQSPANVFRESVNRAAPNILFKKFIVVALGFCSYIFCTKIVALLRFVKSIFHASLYYCPKFHNKLIINKSILAVTTNLSLFIGFFKY